MALSNYPPGETGAARSAEAVFRCANPDCAEYGHTWTAYGTVELGGFFLNRDEDAECACCGEEGVQD